MNEIKCPINNVELDIRKKLLFENIEKYIDSDDFKELVIMFGGKDYSNMTFKEKINYLSDFVKVWDYRNSRERWAIKNDDFINNNKDKIIKLLINLNLVYTRELQSKPDYILVLGGARYSNFNRPIKAKSIYDLCEKKPFVIGLTCDRLLNEVEYDSLGEYIYEIKTEADALGKGIELAFKVNKKSIEDNIVKYNDNIYLISAKSSVDGKRANSFDTFQEFINIFNVKNKNILLVTNQPYTSYQLLKFIELAFDNNLYIEAIGSDSNNTLQESNYLQELKSNIDAVRVLVNKYL